MLLALTHAACVEFNWWEFIFFSLSKKKNKGKGNVSSLLMYRKVMMKIVAGQLLLRNGHYSESAFI